jgi:hypothetical protein
MRATRRGESALLLQDVVEILKSRSVDYAVVGALAGAAHGVIRATTDADAIVRLAAVEASSLRDAVASAGFEVDLRRGGIDDPIAAVLKLKDKFGNRVELLFGIKGLDAGAYARAVNYSMNGEDLRFVSCEDFIAMKLGTGSPLDLRDATHAFKVNRENLDATLLKSLCAKFGRGALAKLDGLYSLPVPGGTGQTPSL